MSQREWPADLGPVICVVGAPAWSEPVGASTGFAPPDGRPLPSLDGVLDRIAEAARPVYERLARHRLAPLN